jgi:hypothetical protein
LATVREFADAAQREALLDEERQAARSQSGVREEVVAELRANRITLVEAAGRFGELNRRMAYGGDQAFRVYPGKSPGESLCRQVIHWVKYRESDPPQPEELACRRRLEAELDKLLERDGEIRLPGSSDSR